jgi:hypothetical protein
MTAGGTARPDFVAEARAVWVDRGWDRDRASDGVSRYGFYLRDRAGWFADLDPSDPGQGEGDRVRFAAAAWTVATGPVMSPPLVATHPRVLGVTAAVDDWGGRHLLLTTELVSGLPAGLGQALGWRWRGWVYDRGFGVWREPDRGGGDPPRLALPTLRLVTPVPAGVLPVPGAAQPDTGQAFAAVDAVVAGLNAALRPVLAVLDGVVL